MTMILKPIDTTTMEYKFAYALAEAELKAHEHKSKFVPFAFEDFLLRPSSYTCQKCNKEGCIFIDVAQTKVLCRGHLWAREKEHYEYNLYSGRSVDWGAVCLGGLQRW